MLTRAWQRGHGSHLAVADRLQRLVHFEQVLDAAFGVVIEVQVRDVLVCLLLLETFQRPLIKRLHGHLHHSNRLLANVGELRVASCRILLQDGSVNFLSLLGFLGALRVAFHPRWRQSLLLIVGRPGRSPRGVPSHIVLRVGVVGHR